MKRSRVLKGIISSESPADKGIPTGTVIITVHDRGIRLKIDNKTAVMDIHNAQLAGLQIETQVKSFQKNQKGILKSIYKFLAMITLGAMVNDMTEEPSTYTKKVDCLVINFWNTASESAQKIYIVGNRKQIQKFIALFD